MHPARRVVAQLSCDLRERITLGDHIAKIVVGPSAAAPFATRASPSFEVVGLDGESGEVAFEAARGPATGVQAEPIAHLHEARRHACCGYQLLIGPLAVARGTSSR